MLFVIVLQAVILNYFLMRKEVKRHKGLCVYSIWVSLLIILLLS